ncbi:hypothetical protein FVE85_0369 [Porphyridium purpureum]|uniref:Uncharacterized protein n=1 Tax=Porphyridium purpureum TaxID=35688 RepID=A0A5J4Z038_PORPP|nr:hypothetical protein FVE85_0369 [Porphyridium purpureum]|eukprot:POR0488..scf208_2
MYVAFVGAHAAARIPRHEVGRFGCAISVRNGRAADCARSGVPRLRRTRHALRLSMHDGAENTAGRVDIDAPPQLTEFDAERDFAWVGQQVQAWLDAEFIPQTCHAQIGSACTEILQKFVADASEPQASDMDTDMAAAVLHVAVSLQERPVFADAFVGPFDVANKVSELLFRRANREVCSCDQSDDERDRAHTETVIRKIRVAQSDALQRMLFMREIVECLRTDHADFEVLNICLWLALGFEYDASTGAWDGARVERQEVLDLMANSATPPDFMRSKPALAILERDIEEDDRVEEGIAEYMETLAGRDLVKALEKKNTESFALRSTAVGWLHNFGDW